MRKGIAMENDQKVLEYIVRCIEETGSNPYDQIMGYIRSGDERYITRNGDARRLIRNVEISRLEQYLFEGSK